MSVMTVSMLVALLMLVGTALVVYGVNRARRQQKHDDLYDSFDESARAERVRVRRAQYDAEQQIRTLTNEALAEMLRAARQAPPPPSDDTDWPDGQWRRP